MKIVPIVEGHGEQDAVPLLLRQIIQEVSPQTQVGVGTAIRVHKHQFINNDNEFRRHVSLARLKAEAHGAILIILDADSDCAATTGPALLQRARAYANDMDIFVCFAIREYEAWLIASLDSLRGQRGIPNNVTVPRDVESVNNPKRWLDQIMGDIRYRETIHQAALTARINTQIASQNSRSFLRLYRHIQQFLQNRGPVLNLA